VLELVAARASVVACVASGAAADAAMDAPTTSACRVAPDEVLLIGAPGEADAVAAAVTERIVAADPDALVLDVTDGWSIWTLEGDAIRAAFSRLSAIPIPESGFAQGDVVRVPVKLVAEQGRLHLLVPAMWSAYLHGMILERCRTLGIAERADPAEWSSTEVRTE